MPMISAATERQPDDDAHNDDPLWCAIEADLARRVVLRELTHSHDRERFYDAGEICRWIEDLCGQRADLTRRALCELAKAGLVECQASTSGQSYRAI